KFRFTLLGDNYPSVDSDGKAYSTDTEFQSNYTINSFRVELIDEIEMFKSFYLGYGLGTTINSVQNELLYKIISPYDPITPVAFHQQPNVEYRDNGRTRVIYDVEGSESEVRQVNAYAIITMGYNLDLWGIIINPYFQANLLLN